jgi:hypothetical protein
MGFFSLRALNFKPVEALRYKYPYIRNRGLRVEQAVP